MLKTSEVYRREVKAGGRFESINQEEQRRLFET